MDSKEIFERMMDLHRESLNTGHPRKVAFSKLKLCFSLLTHLPLTSHFALLPKKGEGSRSMLQHLRPNSGLVLGGHLGQLPSYVSQEYNHLCPGSNFSFLIEHHIKFRCHGDYGPETFSLMLICFSVL